jgi:type VI secretion system secreted protein VgrG
MAEADRGRGLLTGRQSAYLKILPRLTAHKRDADKALPAPDVSVVLWDVLEELNRPYRVRALITSPVALSRKQILGQYARFTIEPEDGRGVREFRGFISVVDAVSESHDQSTYRVVVWQHVAVLDEALNCATYQHKSSPDILREILKRHDDLKFYMQVETNLRRTHLQHAFRFQYNLSDLQFCELQMEQAGLYWYTKQGEHSEVLVIADDIDGYLRPAIKVRDRPTSGLLTFEEAIHSFKVRTRSVPRNFSVGDFNPESAWERIRGQANVRHTEDDPTMHGTPSVWGTHHLDAEGAKREALLRHEAAMAHQVEYRIRSTVLDARPGRVLETDRPHEDARHGMVITRVMHRGARDAGYSNSIRAIPADRPWRKKINPDRWPKIHGTLGATVCSPGSYKYAYLTEKGEYIIRLHCDFGNWPKGGESIPLRLPKPFSGRNHTGMHLPALDGDEALIGFRGGDPNRPIIVGFMPNSTRPDLINATRRRISRNEIRTQSGNKLWMEDWEGQEGIEFSTGHSGRSQLNLGFIPDSDLKERGTGAELRTAAYLVNRGGAGVMTTAYDQPGGSGKVLAMDETLAQFENHQALVKSLAQSAEASKAIPADLGAHQGMHDGLKGLKHAGVLVTGPGPVGIASGDGIQLTADGSIAGSAKKGIQFSTLKRFIVATGDRLSMFAQKGMSLITAAGDFVAQAQRGRMQLASQDDMTVETVNGVMHVKSPKEIVLNCGGSYIRMTPEAIEMGARGSVLFRTSKLKKTGPAQMDLGGAAFAPKFVPFTTNCEVWRTNPDFVPPPTPAPDPAQWDTLANTAAAAPSPSLDAGAMKSAEDGELQEAQSASETQRPPNPTGAANDATQGPPEIPENSIPIRLEKPDPCGNTLPNFKERCEVRRETPFYYGFEWTKDQPANKLVGGEDTTNWTLDYNDKEKKLIALLQIDVELWDVNARDQNGQYLVDENNKRLSFPYQYAQAAAYRRDITYEDVPYDGSESDFDFSGMKKRIEAMLNQGNYKMVSGRCQKGKNCGCRVSGEYKVNFRAVKANSSTWG